MGLFDTVQKYVGDPIKDFFDTGQGDLDDARASADAAGEGYDEVDRMGKEQWEYWKKYRGPESAYGQAALQAEMSAIEKYGPDSIQAKTARANFIKASEFYGPDSELAKADRQERFDYLSNFGSDSTLMKGLLDESRITPEKLKAARSRATADVEAEYGRALEEQQRRNMAMGIDPSSPAAQAMTQKALLSKGSARAGAANKATLGERKFRTGLGMMLSQKRAPTAGYASPQMPGPGFIGSPDAGSYLASQGMTGVGNAAAGYGNTAGAQYAGAGVANQGPWWMPAMNFSAEGGVVEKQGLGMMLDDDPAGSISVPRQPGAGDAEDRMEISPLADRTEGGHLTGPGDETSDSIPAKLSKNEYVIPAFAVLHHGTRKLDKMVEEARKGQSGVPQRVAGEEPQMPDASPKEPALGMMLDSAEGGWVPNFDDEDNKVDRLFQDAGEPPPLDLFQDMPGGLEQMRAIQGAGGEEEKGGINLAKLAPLLLLEEGGHVQDFYPSRLPGLGMMVEAAQGGMTYSPKLNEYLERSGIPLRITDPSLASDPFLASLSGDIPSAPLPSNNPIENMGDGLSKMTAILGAGKAGRNNAKFTYEVKMEDIADIFGF